MTRIRERKKAEVGTVILKGTRKQAVWEALREEKLLHRINKPLYSISKDLMTEEKIECRILDLNKQRL